MKFPQLAIGQRFEWRGRVYVKSGPLAGADVETQRAQIIPRSALVNSAEARQGDRPNSLPSARLSSKELADLLAAYRDETVAWANGRFDPEATAELQSVMSDIARRMVDECAKD